MGRKSYESYDYIDPDYLYTYKDSSVLINKFNEKKASIFSMFPNIMKTLADNQTMMIAITKDKNKYIKRGKWHLTKCHKRANKKSPGWRDNPKRWSKNKCLNSRI